MPGYPVGEIGVCRAYGTQHRRCIGRAAAKTGRDRQVLGEGDSTQMQAFT